ncbi:MAG: type I glyceraldehyde-3-phosphate dehydrogenase [bacterium]
MSTFAINGFGRIGRLAARIWYQYHKEDFTLVAINTSGSMDLSGWAHLFKYDTTYGMFSGAITTEEHQSHKDCTDQDCLLGFLIIDSKYRIPVLAQRDPAKIPWQQYHVDAVIESTGAFLTTEKASLHLHGGAKSVLLAAPGKDASIATVVRGVKEVGVDNIISNASCTTNCISPVMTVLQESFGIEKGMLNTIHSYTDDQNLQDGSHKDLRRARAGASNIVPTSTGAAKTAGKVVDGLSGLFDGLAIRVPTLTASLADITVVLKREVTVEELNQAMIQASKSPRWQGIIATTNEPLVSSDIIGRSESAIVDLGLTQVVGGNLVKVIAWYDNEWGFTNRLVEVAIIMSKNQ